jgi:phage portal protein BeeE
VARASRALGNWLTPRYEGRLKLSYNLDNIPALNAERDALWDRLNQASFLDDAEKRQAVGYGERQGGE